jgi:hypothetical protein
MVVAAAEEPMEGDQHDVGSAAGAMDGEKRQLFEAENL